MARFYVTEQISPRIAETPEGFLVCKDVPIARTGRMVYNQRTESDIMPWLREVEADAHGMVTVLREPDEVFRQETISSFEGKPVTVDHPGDLITPENWVRVAKGSVQDVRRGDIGEDGLLVADLFVTDAEAIETVKSRRKREVSCGYDADYEQIAPGLLRQKNIVGNHVAIVDKGRAGARCVIMDAEKETVMSKLRDAVAAFRNLWKDASDEEKKEAEKEVQDCMGRTKDEGGETSAIEKLTERIGALEESDKKVHETLDAFSKKLTRDQEETEEEKKAREKREAEERERGGTTADALRASFQDAVSRAEILAPGHRMPTFDAAMPAADANRSLHAAITDVLAAAYRTEEGKQAIEVFARGPVKDFRTLDAAALDAIFLGASELVGRKNNASLSVTGRTGGFSQGNTPAAMNKRHREYWAGRK